MKVELPVVTTPLNTGDVAFRDQFRQPMFHLVPLQRTHVHLTEIGPATPFVRRRCGGNFVEARAPRSWRPDHVGRRLVLVLGEVIVFHVQTLGVEVIRRHGVNTLRWAPRRGDKV